MIGCGGKKSGLEGKVVDGKGQPLANVKVAVKMSQPIKGYEQFETTTGADGMFQFGKLFPTSEYHLMFFSDRWVSDQKMKIESGPEGQTKMLLEPVTIRFMDNKEGVIADTKTDLEWFIRPNTDISWHKAQSWVAGLKVAGGGWRMPTLLELRGLYIKGMGQYNIHPLFKLDVNCVWTGQQRGSSSAWFFIFDTGEENNYPDLDCDYNFLRAFAVRSRK